jgi:hypothetical protein
VQYHGAADNMICKFFVPGLEITSCNYLLKVMVKLWLMNEYYLEV